MMILVGNQLILYMKIPQKFHIYFLSHTPILERHIVNYFIPFKKGWKTTLKDLEVVVVGHIPSEIEAFAAKAPMGVIRWWPMEPEDSLEACVQYAKYCASGKEKVVITL